MKKIALLLGLLTITGSIFGQISPSYTPAQLQSLDINLTPFQVGGVLPKNYKRIKIDNLLTAGHQSQAVTSPLVNSAGVLSINTSLLPDPTTINGAGGSVVSGTSPNFTVTSPLQANITGTGGIVVSGTYPNINVDSPVQVNITGVAPITGTYPNINIGAETAAQTPSTAIPASATQIAIPSTDVQGAIGDVATEIKTLQDKNRPYIKTGSTTATNNDNVLSTDNVFHEGKVNIGANESTMPFLPEYTQRVFGNQNLVGTGFNNTGVDFNRETSPNPIVIGQAFVIVDLINGVDGLDPFLYYSSSFHNPFNPIAKFLTLNAAIDYVNSLDVAHVIIRVNNSSNTLRAVISGNKSISKKNVTINGTPATPAFIDHRAMYVTKGGTITYENCRFFTLFTQAFIVEDGCRVNFIYSELTANTTLTDVALMAGGNLYIDASVINFGANNQKLTRFTGNNGGEVIFGNHLPITTINTNGFTGISFGDLTQRNIVVKKFEGVVFPSTLNMAGTILMDANSLALKQSLYDATNINYALTAHTATPIRTPDMTSSSTNLAGVTKAVVVDATGVFGVADLNKVQSIYPTATNGANTPVPTQGTGTMTVSSGNNLLFWNGTIWKQLD